MFGFMGNLVKAAMGNEESQSVDGNAFGFQVSGLSVQEN